MAKAKTTKRAARPRRASISRKTAADLGGALCAVAREQRALGASLERLGRLLEAVSR